MANQPKPKQPSFGEEVLEAAHRACMANEKDLEKSSVCGCFYCEEIFSPSEIEEWLGDEEGLTAFCPHCFVDSVLAEASGYPITKEFLAAMHERYF